MSTLAAKEEIVSCATCAQTRANGDSQRRLLQSTCARQTEDFSRDEHNFLFFVRTPNERQTHVKAGKNSPQSDSFWGKRTHFTQKWPEKRNVVVVVVCIVWGAFPSPQRRGVKEGNGLVSCQHKKRALSLFNNTYNSVVWHMTTTNTRRALLHYYFLRVVTHSRCTLPTFPYPPAPLYSRRQPRLVK